MAEEAAPSPCIQVCTLDRAATLCVGCGRTLGEIGEWGASTPDRQRQIQADANARLRTQLSLD